MSTLLILPMIIVLVSQTKKLAAVSIAEFMEKQHDLEILDLARNSLGPEGVFFWTRSMLKPGV